MKTNVFKKLLYIVSGVMVMGTSFTSCEMEPYEIPAEELYLRNFIKKYGLIDPSQDWNMSTATEVTVIPDRPVNRLNVYVDCGEGTYCVAEFIDVRETVTIPVDVPDGTKELFIEADGKWINTEPGGKVNLAESASRAESRALRTVAWYDDANPNQFEINASTYGENIDVVTYGYSGNRDGLRLGDWTGDWPDEGQPSYQSRYRVGSTHRDIPLVISIKNRVKQKYKLSFQTGLPESMVNLQVFLIGKDGKQFIARETSILQTGNFDLQQYHTFVTQEELPDGDYQLILIADDNVGWGYSGNWGNFNFTPATTTNMAWLMVAEDLGATDDFDFNDIIVRIECVTVNANLLSQQWQVINDDSEHLVLGGTRSTGTFKRLKVTGLAAGGTLPLYLHFFEPTTGQDYIISPDDAPKNPADVTNTTTNYSFAEWHKWFGFDDHRKMINTGVIQATSLATETPLIYSTVEFYVNEGFNMGEYSKFIDYDADLSKLDVVSSTGWNWSDWSSNPGRYTIQGFYITVGGPTLASCNAALYAPAEGAAPQMFLIPDVGPRGNGWEWPVERTNITNVYGNFLNWAHAGGNSTDDSVNSWYRTFTNGAVADKHYVDRAQQPSFD